MGFADIIFFAVIAAFLVFRLFSVLGRSNEAHKTREPNSSENIIDAAHRYAEKKLQEKKEKQSTKQRKNQKTLQKRLKERLGKGFAKRVLRPRGGLRRTSLWSAA